METLNASRHVLLQRGFLKDQAFTTSKTFSPIVKPRTIRLVTSPAVTYNWPFRQLDVNNAFLQGTLSEDVYMVQPPGFVNEKYLDAV